MGIHLVLFSDYKSNVWISTFGALEAWSASADDNDNKPHIF